MSSPIQTLLDKVDYVPVETTPSNDGLPHVTHEGKLKLGDIEILVYVLSTGERIIPIDEMNRIFGGDVLGFNNQTMPAK